MTKGFTRNGKFVPTGKTRSKSALSTSDIIGYNVKLKKKEKIQNPKSVILKNGRHAVKGVGSDGTVMFKFVKTPK